MWIALGIITYLLFWVICIISYTIHYLTDTIQITSFSQVIYTLNAGTEGAGSTIGAAVLGFFTRYWLLLLLGTLVFILYLKLCQRKRSLKKSGQPLFKEKKTAMAFNCSVIAAALITTTVLGLRIQHGYNILGIGDYLANAGRVTDLYENNFVEPGEVNITFPKKKRNLIHIVLESMETSYADPEIGGGYPENLIPELYGLAKSGTDFSASGSDLLNGAFVTDNSGWTVAGLVAQSAGVPLNAGHDVFRGNFTDDSPFMPHLTTLGEILEDEGYRNYFMCGSEGLYAGRENYYRQHGNYEILDYFAAKDQKVIDPDYRVWWGFEDAKLFPWAQKKLTEIAKSEQPFNFTMLTVDTHFADGYQCPDCPDTFDTQYKNVINCSDHKIAEFVKWIQQQDFYEDTTIVLSGDHLSMDASVPQITGSDYDRKTFFAVINGPEYDGWTREFCTLDIFPTIVESLGANIEGHRLGLGTSLYSRIPTLIEEMGLQALNAEVTANSDYYNNVIMSGDPYKREEVKEETPQEPEEETETAAVQPVRAQNDQDNLTMFEDPNYNYDAPVNNTYWQDEPVANPVTPEPADPKPAPIVPETPPVVETPDTPVTPEPPEIETPEQRS